MEFLFEDLFIHISFAIVTACVIVVTLFAYRRGIFLSRIAWSALLYIIVFVVFFLFRQYDVGHITEHAVSESWYVILASTHGIVSLWAIIQAVVMFFFAHTSYQAGINFFKKNKKWTISLIFVWGVSLVSGFFL